METQLTIHHLLVAGLGVFAVVGWWMYLLEKNYSQAVKRALEDTLRYFTDAETEERDK